MHELPVTESILKIVLKHAQANGVRKVRVIRLKAGKLSDLEDEWLQRYFDYLSRGTVAEGARIEIERVPIVMRCNACSESYEVEAAEMGDLPCPACGRKGGTLRSGREYTVKEIEAE